MSERTRSSYSKPMQSLLISPVMASNLAYITTLTGDLLEWANWLENYEDDVFGDKPNAKPGDRRRHKQTDGTPAEPGGWAAPSCGCAQYSLRVVPYSLAVEWAEADEGGRAAIIESMPPVPHGYKTWGEAFGFAARDVWRLAQT